MYFKSVAVDRFRQFRCPLEVTGLTPGLNVIAGDNEEGKSTLFKAVRAALFDKYTSTASDDHRPFGELVSPRVSLVFELDDIEFRLDKVFSRRRDGEARLTASDGRRWEGPQAEDFLAERLGFSYAARGASKPEHQGLAGLLWVEQARAFNPVTLSDQSRRQLHGVFDAEMTQLLGGEFGEALHGRIGEQRGQYFDARNRPRGVYRELQERDSRLAATLEQAREQMRAYQHKIDRLDQLQNSLSRLREDGALARAEARLRAARERQARLQTLVERITSGREKQRRLQAERDAASQAWETRATLIAERHQAHQVLTRADALLERCRADQLPARRRLEGLQSELDARREHHAAQQARLRRARDTEQLRRLDADVARLAESAKQAHAAVAARRRCQAERDAIAVTNTALEALRKLDQEHARVLARVQTAATRIEYRLQPGARVYLADALLAGEGEELLTATASLQVDGIGRFTLHPGGEDLEQLRAQLAEHARRLRDALAELQVADLPAAQKACDARRAWDSEAKQHAARLAGIAPQGVEELEERLAARHGERQALLTRLGDEDAGEDAEALEHSLAELADGIGRLETELLQAGALHTRCREAVIEADTALRAAQHRQQAADAALESARKAVPDDRLAAALADAERAQASGGEQIATLERTLHAEQPDAVAVEVERCEKALQQLSDELHSLEGQVRDLVVELSALGQRGVAEELALAESEHAAVRRELQQVEARALALDLLYRTLDESLRRAKEKVARPVIARLLPYLRQLLPDAEPSVDEDLVLTGISRNRVAEPFSQLSVGTREQLAVLVRLAYADLLSERGAPVTVILDDALVNSDEERRERMKAILYQAARNYQVLLLTCHGREYRDCGGTFIRLAECGTLAG